MKVMLSYRSSDYEFVEKLTHYLKNRGVEPWIDREGISPGSMWRDVLLEQLRTCDACIVVLSPEYLASEHCRMEVFIARSFGRLIVPVMVQDCFGALRDHEETKGLEDIFMMRMHRLSAVGLPIDAEEAFRRVADSVLNPAGQPRNVRPIYVSYSTADGQFATDMARALEAKNIPIWVATLDVRVGENWRDAQARAMLRASAHLVVLDESIVEQAVLRTEILLAEARGLDTFTVLPARLHGESTKIAALMHTLNSSDQTYRRLAQTQYFPSAEGLKSLAERLSNTLCRYMSNSR